MKTPIACFGGPMNGMFAEDIGPYIAAHEGEDGEEVVYQRMVFCLRRPNGSESEFEFARAYVHGDRPTPEQVFGASFVESRIQ